MKLSKYNIIKSDGISTWIFNTFTKAFVKLPAVAYQKIGEEETSDLKKELFKQGILTDESDEISPYKYKYYAHAFDSRLFHLCIAPTMKCNFSCFYCFEEGNKNLPAMSDEVENALVRYIEKNKENRISINWFGGEPLLAFDKIVSICDKLNHKNIDYVSSLVTNGSLLTKSKIARLDLLHLSHIQISLDGPAPIHNRRRCFKNGTPSFDTILSNIDHFIHTTSIPLHIQVAIDKTNASAYHEMLRLFNQNYPGLVDKRIRIGCNFVQDRTTFDKRGVCFTNDDIFDKQVESLKNGEKNDLTPSLPDLSLPCMYRCKNSFAIDPAGDIYKCLEYLGDPQFKVGNLLEGKISYKKVAQATFAESPFEDDACLNCPVLPICGGGCPIDRIKHQNDLNNNYCSIHKTKLADLLPIFYTYSYSSRTT